MQTNLSKANISKLLGELDKCYRTVGSYVELVTGFAGAEAIARAGDEHFLALIEGQHEILARKDTNFAQSVFEGALEIYRHVDTVKKQIVEALLPRIEQLADAFVKKYFVGIPGVDLDEIRAGLIMEGCESVMRKLGRIRYGDFNTYQCFKYICRAAMMGMKRYADEEMRYYASIVGSH